MGTFVTSQRGMTLMEIMLAVAIIGIGLAALLSAVPLAAYGIQEGKQLSTATFLANQRMEQVRNAQWTACPVPPAALPVDKLGVSVPATVAPVSGVVTTFPDESPLPAPYNGYNRQVRIIDTLGPATCPAGVQTGTTGLRQVTVTVSYRPMTGVGVAPAGTTKSAVTTMYMAQR